MATDERPVVFEAIRGVEGVCLALTVVDGYSTRIAGPKPWSGGSVIHRWEVKPSELRRELPDLTAQARAEASEQRVREVEEQLRDDVRSVEAETSQTLIEVERKLEAKLSTAIEALRRFATRWHYAGQPIAEVEKIRQEAQQALSEIEQGDAK